MSFSRYGRGKQDRYPTQRSQTSRRSGSRYDQQRSGYYNTTEPYTTTSATRYNYGSKQPTYDDSYNYYDSTSYGRSLRGVGYTQSSSKYSRATHNNMAGYDVSETPRRYEYSQQYRARYPTYDESNSYDYYGRGDESYFFEDYYSYDDPQSRGYYPQPRHEKSRSREKYTMPTTMRTFTKQVDGIDGDEATTRYRQTPLSHPVRDEAVVHMETQHDKTEKLVMRLLQTRPVVYQFIEQEMYRIYEGVPSLTKIFEKLLSSAGMEAFHSRLPRVMKVEEIYERLCDAIRVEHRSRGVPNIFMLIHNDVVGLQMPRRVYSDSEQLADGFDEKIRTRFRQAAQILSKRHWDQWYWKADSSRIDQAKDIHSLPTTQFATTRFLQDFNANYADVKMKWMNTIVQAWPSPVEDGKMYYPTAIVWRQKFGWACEFSTDDNVKLVRLDTLTNEDRARKKRSRHGKPQQIHFVHLLRLAKTTQVHMSADEAAKQAAAASVERKNAAANGEQKSQEVHNQQAVRGNDFARHIRSGRDFWINSSRVTLPMCACEMQTGNIKNMKVYSFRCCRRVFCKLHAEVGGFRCAYCRNYYHYTCKFNVYAKDIVRYRPGTTVCRYKDCQRQKIHDDLEEAITSSKDGYDEEREVTEQIINLVMDFTVGTSRIIFPCTICNDKSLIPGDCRECDSCYLCVEGNPQHYFTCETCGSRTCKLGSFVYGKKCPRCFEDSKQ